MIYQSSLSYFGPIKIIIKKRTFKILEFVYYVPYVVQLNHWLLSYPHLMCFKIQNIKLKFYYIFYLIIHFIQHELQHGNHAAHKLQPISFKCLTLQFSFGCKLWSALRSLFIVWHSWLLADWLPMSTLVHYRQTHYFAVTLQMDLIWVTEYLIRIWVWVLGPEV